MRIIFVAVLGFMAFSAAAAEAPVGNPILDPTAMDQSVNPCEDFYQYSCGNWLKRTEIPSDQASWGRSFSVIADQNYKTLNGILSDYSRGNFNVKTPYAEKLGKFYSSCMDTDAIEKETAQDLASALAEVDALKDRAGLPALVARLQLRGVNLFFSFGGTADLKDPTLDIAEIDQGGMGLPDSTYYTQTSDPIEKLRQAYRDHMAAMLKLAGVSDTQAVKMASEDYAIELTLARSALPPENLQDPTLTYHPVNADGLQKEAPAFDWSAYFAASGIHAPAIINTTEPNFLYAMNSIVRDQDLESIRSYIKIHLIDAIAPYLGQRVYAEWFAFEGTTMNGQTTPAPRWKKCVRAVSSAMGEALGQAFVATSFSPQAKERVLGMIDNLRHSFEQDLAGLDWLDSATRSAALKKLSMLSRKIGYPDKWRDYDGLEVGSSFVSNAMNSNEFESRRMLAKIGGKVDPTEWGMSPQTVNAYYDPSTNSVNFPAAILQPPFFSDQADDASNYGAIGMVIGHEMTHGFDTTGSKFDGTGAESDWWSPAVKKLFDEKASCLKNQYSKYEVLPGLFVNGKLTITENIADFGGLKLSYSAYKLAREGKPPEPTIAGLNGDQQFFVSMAQIWCEKDRKESLARQVSGDPHSPAKFRVIGTMVNRPEFAAAFGCPVGSPMAPKDRCSIW